MAGAWERQETALGVILHTDNTTLAWAFGLRALDFPGHFIGLAGMPFDHARNAGAQRALDMGVDWLFFLDSDVIPPADAVRRLISRRKPIISGIYHRRSPPHGVPVMLKGGKWIESYPANSIIDVDLVGAGCLLIHTSVLRNLPPQREGKHWFDWRVDRVAIDPPGTAMSEDFTFNLHARTVGGYKIFVDTSVVCKHVGFAEAGYKSLVPLDTAGV
jgi:hypothetical protein